MCRTKGTHLLLILCLTLLPSSLGGGRPGQTNPEFIAAGIRALGKYSIKLNPVCSQTHSTCYGLYQKLRSMAQTLADERVSRVPDDTREKIEKGATPGERFFVLPNKEILKEHKSPSGEAIEKLIQANANEWKEFENETIYGIGIGCYYDPPLIGFFGKWNLVVVLKTGTTNEHREEGMRALFTKLESGGHMNYRIYAAIEKIFGTLELTANKKSILSSPAFRLAQSIADSRVIQIANSNTETVYSSPPKYELGGEGKIVVSHSNTKGNADGKMIEFMPYDMLDQIKDLNVIGIGVGYIQASFELKKPLDDFPPWLVVFSFIVGTGMQETEAGLGHFNAALNYPTPSQFTFNYQAQVEADVEAILIADLGKSVDSLVYQRISNIYPCIVVPVKGSQVNEDNLKKILKFHRRKFASLVLIHRGAGYSVKEGIGRSGEKFWTVVIVIGIQHGRENDVEYVYDEERFNEVSLPLRELDRYTMNPYQTVFGTFPPVLTNRVEQRFRMSQDVVTSLRQPQEFALFNQLGIRGIGLPLFQSLTQPTGAIIRQQLDRYKSDIMNLYLDSGTVYGWEVALVKVFENRYRVAALLKTGTASMYRDTGIATLSAMLGKKLETVLPLSQANVDSVAMEFAKKGKRILKFTVLRGQGMRIFLFPTLEVSGVAPTDKEIINHIAQYKNDVLKSIKQEKLYNVVGGGFGLFMAGKDESGSKSTWIVAVGLTLGTEKPYRDSVVKFLAEQIGTGSGDSLQLINSILIQDAADLAVSNINASRIRTRDEMHPKGLGVVEFTFKGIEIKIGQPSQVKTEAARKLEGLPEIATKALLEAVGTSGEVVKHVKTLKGKVNIGVGYLPQDTNPCKQETIQYNLVVIIEPEAATSGVTIEELDSDSGADPRKKSVPGVDDDSSPNSVSDTEKADAWETATFQFTPDAKLLITPSGCSTTLSPELTLDNSTEHKSQQLSTQPEEDDDSELNMHMEEFKVIQLPVEDGALESQSSNSSGQENSPPRVQTSGDPSSNNNNATSSQKPVDVNALAMSMFKEFRQNRKLPTNIAADGKAREYAEQCVDAFIEERDYPAWPAPTANPPHLLGYENIVYKQRVVDTGADVVRSMMTFLMNRAMEMSEKNIIGTGFAGKLKESKDLEQPSKYVFRAVLITGPQK